MKSKQFSLSNVIVIFFFALKMEHVMDVQFEMRMEDSAREREERSTNKQSDKEKTNHATKNTITLSDQS